MGDYKLEKSQETKIKYGSGRFIVPFKVDINCDITFDKERYIIAFKTKTEEYYRMHVIFKMEEITKEMFEEDPNIQIIGFEPDTL